MVACAASTCNLGVCSFDFLSYLVMAIAAETPLRLLL